MNQRRLLIRFIPAVIAVAVILFQFSPSKKTTNEAGRTARHALSPRQEETLGLQSFDQVLEASDLVEAGPDFELVTRVARRLAATRPAVKNFRWQAALVRDPAINAFCLPGGKLVVHTGLLPIAETEAGLAAVLAHAMAHATLRHGSERLLQEKAHLAGLQNSADDMNPAQQRSFMGAIGTGAHYGVPLPFSPDHESEADKIGLLSMARAGYDPAEAVAFWQRMSATSAAGEKPFEFLSIHPADSARIARLQELLPEAQAEYQRAKPRHP